MTKSDLIQSISKKVCIHKSTATQCLTVVLDEVIKELSQGREVILPGFGKFVVSHRKERDGRNPKTGEKIKIPAMKVPRFKAGKTLKDAVR